MPKNLYSRVIKGSVKCYVKIPYSMSINVHNEEITYLHSPIITCLNIDFRRIKLQQIVLFGVNLCLRLGIRKPSQYHLDALKKNVGAAKHIVCDCLCAMVGAHIMGTKGDIRGKEPSFLPLISRFVTHFSSLVKVRI